MVLPLLLGTILTDLGVVFLLAGYSLVIAFIVIERALRRTGAAKTFRRGAFDRGSTMLVGAAFGVGLLLPLILDVLGIGLFSMTYSAGFLALSVMVIGIGLRVWAASTLGKYYTRTLVTANEQTVITSGPYAKIRHPGYLGDLLMWSDFGVLSSNVVVGLVLPLMFLGAYLYRISVEERMLAQAFGDEYVRYQKRTNRIIPFVY